MPISVFLCFELGYAHVLSIFGFSRKESVEENMFSFFLFSPVFYLDHLSEKG